MFRSIELGCNTEVDAKIIMAIRNRRKLQIKADLRPKDLGNPNVARLLLVPKNDARRYYHDGTMLITWDCDCEYCFDQDGDDLYCASAPRFSKELNWPPSKKRTLLTYTEKPCTVDQVRELYDEITRAWWIGPDDRTLKERSKDKKERKLERKKERKLKQAR